MKLIMENWRKFLAEEKVCVDGTTPTKAIGSDALLCRDGSTPVEQNHAEAPAEAPDPTKYTDTIKLDTPRPPFEGEIPGTITILRDIPFFEKYITKAEDELPPPTSGLKAITDWNAMLTFHVAKQIQDDARNTAKDISKEFEYAKQVATKKANDFVTNHLDGENATHRQIYRQLKKDLGRFKKDLQSLNPFN